MRIKGVSGRDNKEVDANPHGVLQVGSWIGMHQGEAPQRLSMCLGAVVAGSERVTGLMFREWGGGDVAWMAGYVVTAKDSGSYVFAFRVWRRQGSHSEERNV